MAYATGTTHYNLPQTVGTDKRDWADTNQAFSDIDAAIYGAVSDVATAGTAISGLESRMTTAEGNIATNAGNITSLDTRMTTAEGAITSLGTRVSDVSADLEDMICAYNEPTATSTHVYSAGDYFIYNDVLYRATESIGVGDTIVPDSNCTTTNVSTELLATNSRFLPQVIATSTANGVDNYRTVLSNLIDGHYSELSEKIIVKWTTSSAILIFRAAQLTSGYSVFNCPCGFLSGGNFTNEIYGIVFNVSSGGISRRVETAPTGTGVTTTTNVVAMNDLVPAAGERFELISTIN